MKNETRNKTRAGARGSGGGRAGTGGSGARGSGDGRAGTGGSGARGSSAITLDEHGAILGTAPIEDREQPGGDQREPAPVEAPSKSASPNSATRAEAGTRKAAASTRTAATKTPDDSEQEVSRETRETLISLILSDPRGSDSNRIRDAGRRLNLSPDIASSIWREYKLSQKTNPEFEISESRPLSSPAQKFRPGGKKAREQAEQTALTLLTILDGAIGMTLGAECAMTPDEHKMVDEPLARILARMAPETTELIDRWTDPLLLATGLIMWGARVFLVLSREVKREAKKHKPEPFQPEPAEPSIGLDLNHPIQATGIPVEVAEALG